MRSLSSDKIGKLVTVVGTVVRVSALRPVIDQMGFQVRAVQERGHAAAARRQVLAARELPLPR